MSPNLETIVAVSSPPGRAPLALIRLSGPRSDSVLSTLIGRAAAIGDSQLPPVRQLVRVSLHIPPTPDPLPARVIRFAAPRSFTGESMAELQIPGNPALVDRVVHHCVAAGARLAQPGEFSFRAYLNRKIDLTQAEGIAATIAAQTDAQLAAASLLRQGRLGALASQLVQRIAEALALVEAGIDFTDQDDVVPIAPRQLVALLQEAASQLDLLLDRSRSWGALQTLPRVALVGPPSAGKSTLFNALLGTRRAVTSATPGTTRDVLAETIDLPPTPVSPIAAQAMLLDIAGLDSLSAATTESSALDRDIQSAAQSAIASADLLLLITPAEAVQSHEASDSNLATSLPVDIAGKPVLHVRTKCDQARTAPTHGLAVSAHRGVGLDALRYAIADALASHAVSLTAQSLALQPRHEAALRSTRASLADAIDRANRQGDSRALAHSELIAGALRQALDSLACLGGDMSPDDVIGLVFSRFCVGK